MARYNTGEYIKLYWDGPVESLFVKGHVTHDQFWAAVEGYEDQYYARAEIHHTYGRWSTEWSPIDGVGQVLRTYTLPGPGRFPITVAKATKAQQPEITD